MGGTEKIWIGVQRQKAMSGQVQCKVANLSSANIHTYHTNMLLRKGHLISERTFRKMVRVHFQIICGDNSLPHAQSFQISS